MKLDILAFGAHPDDVELGCSGTIAKEVSLGKKERAFTEYSYAIGISENPIQNQRSDKPEVRGLQKRCGYSESKINGGVMILTEVYLSESSNIKRVSDLVTSRSYEGEEAEEEEERLTRDKRM